MTFVTFVTLLWVADFQNLHTLVENNLKTICLVLSTFIKKGHHFNFLMHFLLSAKILCDLDMGY